MNKNCKQFQDRRQNCVIQKFVLLKFFWKRKKIVKENFFLWTISFMCFLSWNIIQTLNFRFFFFFLLFFYLVFYYWKEYSLFSKNWRNPNINNKEKNVKKIFLKQKQKRKKTPKKECFSNFFVFLTFLFYIQKL